MRKILTIAALLVCAQCFAQLTPQEYKEKYDRQVRNVGHDGVGVETLLDNWEKAYPEDTDAKMGRFYYYYYKSQDTQMVPKDCNKYLGNQPSMSLKDENGKTVNYFEEVFFDDACFAESQRVIDDLIKQHPDDLGFKCSKITSIMVYEKEDPTMTATLLMNLVNTNNSKHPSWTYNGEKVSEEEFCNLIQEYCTSLYLLGSEGAYSTFNDLSAVMSKAYPKYAGFLDNQGTYWLVCQKNFKKAISFYDKALKIDPEDQAAIANKRLAERQIEKSKSKKKK